MKFREIFRAVVKWLDNNGYKILWKLLKNWLTGYQKAGADGYAHISDCYVVYLLCYSIAGHLLGALRLMYFKIDSNYTHNYEAGPFFSQKPHPLELCNPISQIKKIKNFGQIRPCCQIYF